MPMDDGGVTGYNNKFSIGKDGLVSTCTDQQFVPLDGGLIGGATHLVGSNTHTHTHIVNNNGRYFTIDTPQDVRMDHQHALPTQQQLDGLLGQINIQKEKNDEIKTLRKLVSMLMYSLFKNNKNKDFSDIDKDTILNAIKYDLAETEGFDYSTNLEMIKNRIESRNKKNLVECVISLFQCYMRDTCEIELNFDDLKKEYMSLSEREIDRRSLCIEMLHDLKEVNLEKYNEYALRIKEMDDDGKV